MRIDPHTKTQAEQLFYSCGLTMSGAISLFIHQFLSAQGLPFNVHSKDAQSGGIVPESAEPRP